MNEKEHPCPPRFERIAITPIVRKFDAFLKQPGISPESFDTFLSQELAALMNPHHQTLGDYHLQADYKVYKYILLAILIDRLFRTLTRKENKEKIEHQLSDPSIRTFAQLKESAYALLGEQVEAFMGQLENQTPESDILKFLFQRLEEHTSAVPSTHPPFKDSASRLKTGLGTALIIMTGIASAIPYAIKRDIGDSAPSPAQCKDVLDSSYPLLMKLVMLHLQSIVPMQRMLFSDIENLMPHIRIHNKNNKLALKGEKSLEQHILVPSDPESLFTNPSHRKDPPIGCPAHIVVADESAVKNFLIFTKSPSTHSMKDYPHKAAYEL